MYKSIVVAVDSDNAFLERFSAKLDELGALSEFGVKPILTRGTTPEEIAANCVAVVSKLLDSGSSIAVVFVDIVIFEGRNPVDQSGLSIAASLSSAFPTLPIIGMTVHYNDHRLLSEISFDTHIQGVLLKAFFEDQTFRRKDLFSIIERAKRKLMNQRDVIAEVPVPRRTLEESEGRIEGRFEIGNDPQTQFQSLEVGPQALRFLLEMVFPEGSGTVSSLRPGFSGSFLFKVQVVSAPDGISASGPQTWIVKVTNQREKLQMELEATLRLKSRVDRKFYPPLYREELTYFNGWSAIALAIAEKNAVTLYEYFQKPSNGKKMVELVQTSLVPFLTSLYGTGIPDQAYLWQKYFSLDPRVIAGISAFLDQSRARVRKHLGAKGTGTLERIEKFVRSNGSSERAISQLESTVDTRYIHGDLNSRNLLVPASSKEFVFIDFANSKQDHAMKDIAKLETDLLLLAMDSGQWEDTEWDALDEWGKLVDLYRRGNLLSSSCAASVTTSPKSVQTVARLIQELRRGLRIMLGDGINEREYIVALLHYAMRYLSYPDISLPKKIFTISYVVSDM